MLCDYGCGQEAKFPPGKYRRKWCCSKSPNSCPENRRKNKESHIGQKNHMFKKRKENHPMFGKTHTKESKEKNRNSQKGKTWEEIYGEEKAKKLREKWRGKNNPNYLTIEKIKERYPFFSQIEEMRYNPDKHGEKEIQVHCKNHLCPNSKEKSGWFTPTRIQLAERIRQLENQEANDGCYFYCSKRCKNICPLFNLQSDPFKETNNPYTQQEYKIFKEFVLERDNYECQYCGEPAIDVHHERPQKLEPFFSLDPDFAWSCCKKCHYKYGHKTGSECSTGKLATKVCN